MIEPILTNKVQNASPEDYSEMSCVIARCLKEVNSKDYSEDVVTALLEKYSLKNLTDFFEGKYVLVLKRGSQVIGTGVIFENEITTVFINPDFQHQGLGRIMMNSLEAEALSQGLSQVEINSSITAVKFYENLGYEHLRFEDREIGGESFRMVKKL